jgi:thymidylate synthase ThyX
MTTLGYSARILADSISTQGDRITTFEVTLPRMVLSEWNTHRALSRNSASSRAIPLERRHKSSPPGQIERVSEYPAMPVHWGANQSGMQAQQELAPAERAVAEMLWLAARDSAVGIVRATTKIGETGLHKQVAARLLEPFMWQTIISTATEWDHFYSLRADIHAQPEIRRIAEMMREAHEASAPQLLGEGEWHLPLIHDEDRIAAAEQFPDDPDVLLKISTGRCARVSYLTHDGVRDLAKDIELHDILTKNGHMSPCEHPCRPTDSSERRLIAAMQAVLDEAAASGTEVPRWMRDQTEFAGNARGWVQYRKTLLNENDYSLVKAELAKAGA